MIISTFGSKAREKPALPEGAHGPERQIYRVSEGPVAQWIRHRSTEPEIAGSSPAGVSFFSVALTAAADKTLARFAAAHERHKASVAQLVSAQVS